MENSVPPSDKVSIKASDLRGILEYVPLYRGQTFVVAIDGSVVACDNFANVITDIAVLRSLGINVVVVCGIGKQLKDAGVQKGVKLSDVYGDSPVDDQTLSLAREVSASTLQIVVDAFSTKNIRCVSTNAVRATEFGIVSGVDFQNAGRIEKIDFATLQNLLSLGMIPVMSPMAVNRDGRIFRINSDLLASDVASGLDATKLIFLTETRGLLSNDEKALAVPLNDVEKIMREREALLDFRVPSKVQNAVKALQTGRTQRAHILDGRDFACLLTELFEKVGCGTMIYSDEYQKIRKATADDVSTIYNLSKNSTRSQNLVYRSRDEIAEKIDTYFVYEMDGSIIAFVSLLDITEGSAELASLHVQPFYQGHDVGTHMVDFIVREATNAGFKKLFALSTKSAPFFSGVCKFDEVSPTELPSERLKKYEASARNSKVFLKKLS
ncbi:MAG: amino-acid N-acetyltransferase [Opitutales bacterium]|nr:amino-acid N-acetyltransferase [Opitutales bacterium]